MADLFFLIFLYRVRCKTKRTLLKKAACVYGTDSAGK